MPHIQRFLAIYLIAIGIFQLVLYGLVAATEDNQIVFYLDPRIGLFFIETVIRGSENLPALSGVFSAIFIILIGILIWRHIRIVKLYFVSELLLSSPSIIFFLMVLGTNLQSNHGFSIGELPVPLLVFLFVTVMPLLIGLRLYFSASKGLCTSE